jgi:hypothetical protein
MPPSTYSPYITPREDTGRVGELEVPLALSVAVTLEQFVRANPFSDPLRLENDGLSHNRRCDHSQLAIPYYQSDNSRGGDAILSFPYGHHKFACAMIVKRLFTKIQCAIRRTARVELDNAHALRMSAL